MKRLLSILTAMVLWMNGTAQVAPDNDAILEHTIDSSSPYYYPALKLRYDRGDTTLTAEDYRHLYYGYAYRDEYRPLEEIPAEAELLMILERNPEPDSAACRDIIGKALEVMKADPFSPQNINFLTYAYTLLGDTTGARINARRLARIAETITGSGSGLKIDSPWHVLRFQHAADIIALRGLDIRKREVMNRTVEYVSLMQKAPDNAKGYYFDFGRVYWKRPDTLPRTRTGGLQLNNYQIIKGNKK